MTQTVVPFDQREGQPVKAMYEADWTSLWNGTLSSGVIGRAGSLASSSALQVYTDQDGKQVKVRAGTAHISGHLYRSDATTAVPIAANTSGQSRIDYVTVRLDTTAQTAALFVIAGTPGASPSTPTLTQVAGGVFDIPLARVTVPANFTTIIPANVVEARAWASPIGFDRWYDYNPALAQADGGPVPTLVSDAFNSARFMVSGRMCHVQWTGRVSVSGQAGRGYAISLPVQPSREGIVGAGYIQGDAAAAYTVLPGGAWRVNLYGSNDSEVTDPYSVTLAGDGTGYQDLPIPLDTYVNAWINPADPAASGYPPRVYFAPLSWNGGIRLTMSGGTGANSFTYSVRRKSLRYLTPNVPFNDSFSLIYEIAPGA